MRLPVDEAIDTVARTIYGEARSCSMLDRLRVGSVIRERAMRPGWWGKDWITVCKSPHQFTCWTEGDPNRKKLLYAESDPSDCFSGIYALAQYVVRDMTDEDARELFGLLDGADIPTHYHDRSLSRPPKSWGDNIAEVYRPGSAFRWYVVYQGRPPRKDAPVYYLQG